MTLPRARISALAIVAALLLLPGCVDDAPIGGTASASVDVATPELIRMKQQAGIADCPRSMASHPTADDALPDATLPCLGGGRDVRMDSLDGPLVINAWASYCAPCRAELPVLQRIHEAAGDELTVLGIDYEDSAPAAALQLASDSGVTFPSVADPAGELRADLQIIALPQTLFVDDRGAIVAIERRELTSFDLAADLVEEHLGVDVDAKPAARTS
jgi:cytochrome c biogenesis protein CcmG/thiol:disulfide interchange protein DsbE